MVPTPILTLHLLDEKILNNSAVMTAYYNGVQALTKKHKALFDKEKIPLSIFHNDEIAYSGVQFTRYREAASFTAVGEKEVRAIEIWYDLFQKNIRNIEQNTQIIREQYIPAITKEYNEYTASNILIKDEIGKEINLLKSAFSVRDRLEKYLYGNIKSFLINVAGMEISDKEFISVRVGPYRKKGLKPTFHGGELESYEIDFAVNVYLPQTVRLGQSVSLGYGEIKHK